MTEATITAILVTPGMHVNEGDPVVEVETDKALTEVHATRSGTVEAIEVNLGDTIEIGAALVLISDRNGAEPSAAAAADITPATAPGADAASDANASRPTAGPHASPASKSGPSGPDRIRAAPVARRAAERLGISLAKVNGTGPGGRITLGDVETAAEAATGTEMPEGAEPPPSAAAGAPPAAPAGTAAPGGAESMSATRRSVARRMSASAQIPQFALEREIDATWLLDAKESLAASASEAPISLNDLLISALAETVQRHHELAGSYVEAEQGGHPMIRRTDRVDVGIAVATDRGLLVAVIRDAARRSLREVAAERRRLVDLARAGRLAAEEMTGATVTLSNLGAFGVDRFAAMLNPGEAGILAVGRIVERVLPCERGIIVAPTLALTLTLDHRVIDGAAGGAALAELAELLQGAMAWRL